MMNLFKSSDLDEARAEIEKLKNQLIEVQDRALKYREDEIDRCVTELKKLLAPVAVVKTAPAKKAAPAKKKAAKS